MVGVTRREPGSLQRCPTPPSNASLRLSLASGSPLYAMRRAWVLIAPLLPAAATTRRPQKWASRLLFEAVLYLLRTGSQWRALPPAFRPTAQSSAISTPGETSACSSRSTTPGGDRPRARRPRSLPICGSMDSQSLKTSETGGTKGNDGGKKLVGHKRHILVDAAGRLLGACVSPVDMHDSRVAPQLLGASRRPWPFVEVVFADSAYRGERVGWASPIRVEIVTGPQTSVASSSKSAVGWSSEPSPGSDEFVASSGTTSAAPPPRSPSSSSPLRQSSSNVSLAHCEFRGTL